MTGFDILVLTIIGGGAALGFMRGFVQEVVALGAWLVALLAIYAAHTPLTTLLQPHVHTASGAAVLAFVLLALVPYALTRALAKYLGSASRSSILGPVDRVLGFGFGAVKGTVIVVLAFSLLMLAYDTIWGAAGRPGWLVQSRTYPFVNACSDALVKMIGQRRREAEEKNARHHDADDTDDPSDDSSHDTTND